MDYKSLSAATAAAAEARRNQIAEQIRLMREGGLGIGGGADALMRSPLPPPSYGASPVAAASAPFVVAVPPFADFATRSPIGGLGT